jgi:hypothetical protein
MVGLRAVGSGAAVLGEFGFLFLGFPGPELDDDVRHSFSAFEVLFVANFFQPVDGLAVELFLNGDVHHGRGD